MARVPPGVHIVLDFVLRQGDFGLEIHERSHARALALVGPSGAGKTTVLDAIAGLRRPTAGTIAVDGRTVFDSSTSVDLSPADRRVGYVPQDVALFPHLSVRRNITYGRGRGHPPSLDRVVEILELATLLDREIGGLSGGERQRVAVARALMSAPDLLLLDEPLAAVDDARRDRILAYLERVQDELGTPMVYVSHSVAEVRRLADRVVRLVEGRVAAVETLTGDRPGAL